MAATTAATAAPPLVLYFGFRALPVLVLGIALAVLTSRERERAGLPDTGNQMTWVVARSEIDEPARVAGIPALPLHLVRWLLAGTSLLAFAALLLAGHRPAP